MAKKNGTFKPPIRIQRRKVEQRKEVTVREFLDEYVEVYGLKK